MFLRFRFFVCCLFLFGSLFCRFLVRKKVTFLVAVVAFAAFVALAPFTKWRVLIYSNQGSVTTHQFVWVVGAGVACGLLGLLVITIEHFPGLETFMKSHDVLAESFLQNVFLNHTVFRYLNLIYRMLGIINAVYSIYSTWILYGRWK